MRLVSLDAFRGLTVFGMLLVNNVALDALTPATLTHAEWSGEVNFADVVFPWFLLVVGLALSFSLASQLSRGMSTWKFLQKAVVRTMALIALGWLVDSAVQHRLTIGLGVLQLIGLSYLFAVLFVRLPWWARSIIAMASLALHWAILRFLPMPDGLAGTFTEQTNAIRYLNDVYLEPLHLRGLTSVLTTGPLVLIGTCFGDAIRAGRAWMKLIAGGTLLTVVGLIVELDQPMNKPLWTTSYVLFTAGLGVLTLSALHLLFDRPKVGKFAFPLVVFGSNAIVAYVVPILFKTLVLRVIPAQPGGTLDEALRLFAKDSLGPLNGGLLFTGAYIVFWWLVLLILYRKRLFLKV